MIKQLTDPANAITGIGLMLSVLAIYVTIGGAPALGVAIALWALLADHLDGVVAARTQGRAVETGKIGKSLDSLADLVSAGVLPGVVLIVVAEGAVWALATAMILAVASALRLSYFNAFGLDGNRFIGVPTTYVLPVTAAAFLAAPLFSASAFQILLALALLLVACLHVGSLRVPKTEGRMYLVVTAYCVVASAILFFREV